MKKRKLKLPPQPRSSKRKPSESSFEIKPLDKKKLGKIETIIKKQFLRS